MKLRPTNHPFSEEELVEVQIETTLGAKYSFPDVPWKVVWHVISSDTLHGFPQLSLVNTSNACLVLPTAIIKSISVDSQVFWSKE